MLLATDLFCGAGGWSLACRELEIMEMGLDFNKKVLATREAAGFEDSRLFDISKESPFLHGDILIASPPCQPFSMANYKQGEDLDKMALTIKVLDWIKLGYEKVVMENVKKALPYLEEIAAVLRELGFYVWTGVLNAEQYGTPQARKRAVLIASLHKEVGRPKPTHSQFHRWSPEKLDAGVLPWTSMAKALSHRNDLPDWAHHRPSPTIVGSFRPEVVAAPGYRTNVSRQNTPNSVIIESWEGGVLQDFPSDFPWQGGKNAQFLQVGNAIPVKMAKAILLEVI
jgi:DNA (cytosine-5)-methyltransferase 1